MNANVMKTNNGKRLFAAILALAMIVCAVAVVASPVSAADETAPVVDVSKAQTYTVDSADDFVAGAFGGAYDASNKILVVPADGMIIDVTADVTISDLRIVLNGDLQITGDGKLSITATSKGTAYAAYAITINSNGAVLSIKGADVTIDTNETRGSAINNMYSYTPGADGEEGTWKTTGITGGISVTEKGTLTVKHTAGGTTWLGGSSVSGTPWLIVNDATVNFDGTQAIHGVVLDADKADINFTNVLIGITTLGGSSLADSSIEVNGADYNGIFIKGDITLENSTIDVKNSGKHESNPRSGIMVLSGETDAVTVTMDSTSTLSTTESIMVSSAGATGFTDGTNAVEFVGGTVSGTFEPAKTDATTVAAIDEYTLNGTTISNSNITKDVTVTAGANGIGISGNVNAASGSEIDLTNGDLNIYSGANADLDQATFSATTNNVIVGKDANCTTPEGVTQTEVKDESTKTVNDYNNLINAVMLGYPEISLGASFALGGDLTVPAGVSITGVNNTITLGDKAIVGNGGCINAKIAGDGENATVNLTGNYTIRAGSVVIEDLNGTNPVTSSNLDGDSVTVESGDVVEITGALNSKLTVNLNGGTVLLNNLNITSSGSIYFTGTSVDLSGTPAVTATGTVSVYGQIMSVNKMTIEAQDNTTFRAYGGSVLQDTVSVVSHDVNDETTIINLDGAMYTLTINDDINSSNIYGQTQTVVIGSTLDIVSGTTIEIQGQFVVNEGVTLTIQNGATLIINGTTSVMDVNGNIIVEDGGTLEVRNSQAVDIAGSVEIYGDMNVKGGAVTVQENGNVTVAVGGALNVSTGTTVKAGATVDILGNFDIDDITNAGTISLTGAVMNGASNITLKNGGTVNINSYTVAAGSTALTVTDGQNSITFTPDTAETGFSGAVITTASVKDADNNNAEVFTMSVSGSIGAVDSTGENQNAKYEVAINGSTTVAKAKVAVSGDLTVGEDVSVTNSGKLEVSGTVTATAGTFNNGAAGVIDVTGTVTVTGNAPLTGTVNAAYYVTTVTTGTNAGTTTTYTTFEDAVQSGATRVTVGVGSATVVVTDSVTVPGTVTNVTVSSNATLQVGATDNRDITVTVSDGSRVTGKIVVLATMTFENSRNDNASVTSDVVINESPARTYTNLYTALASGAETVTLAGPVTLTSNITVPEGPTLVVPAGTGVQFNEGVTMTVDGAVQTAVDFTCLDDDDGNTVTFTDKSASTTDNTAKIVVNGKFTSSVTGRTDAGMYGLYKIPGAYYDISDSTGAFTVIAPVVAAAAEAAADIVDGSIVVYGEVSMGDVAFNGTADDTLVIDILGKSTGNVTLSYATLDIDAQFTGSVSTAVGSIDLVNVTGIEVQDAYVEKDGSDVEYMYLTGTPAPVDADVDASLTVASGNVTVPAVSGGNLTIAETQVIENNETVTVSSVAFEVASGATLTINGAVDVYDVTVNGTVTAVDNGRLVADYAYVFGTLTVAEADTASGVTAGSAEIGTLYVGLDDNYDNMTAATVDGQVGNVDLMVVSAESTVSEGLLDDFSASTAFNVEGSVWFTAYASNNSVPVTVDDVKVENALFIGWSDEENGDAIEAANSTPEDVVYQTTFNVGQYNTLYAVVDYEIYTVAITADAGIGTVAVDGKVLAKTDNVFIITGLTAGSHTIDYILNSGFEGTPTITVNGTAITGNTFTLSGTDDLTVEISIYGTQPAAPSQGGSTASGDDGLGLTDYLLIVLVILIIIMAIIVAMRLMRS